MQPWKVCRFCQLSHQDFAAAQEERRSEVRGEAGSEPNAEFAAGRPRSQDSKGEGAGAPREKPAPEPRGRRSCGRRKARLRRDAHLSLRSPQRTGVLTWGGELRLTAARGRENPSWFHESQPLGWWNPPLAAHIPTHPSPPRVAQARGRPAGPQRPYLAGVHRFAEPGTLKSAGAAESCAWSPTPSSALPAPAGPATARPERAPPPAPGGRRRPVPTALLRF